MADQPKPPLTAKAAAARPKPKRLRVTKRRAPFLPKEPHPHGWLAKRSLKGR